MCPLECENVDTIILLIIRAQVRESPSTGAYVYGLFLEGAAWDRRTSRLTESRPKSLFEPLPVLHLQAIDISREKEIPKENLKNMYVCPVYKKPKRTDLTFITPVYLRCPVTKQSEHWTMRGVALLCDTK